MCKKFLGTSSPPKRLGGRSRGGSGVDGGLEGNKNCLHTLLFFPPLLFYFVYATHKEKNAKDPSNRNKNHHNSIFSGWRRPDDGKLFKMFFLSLSLLWTLYSMYNKTGFLGVHQADSDTRSTFINSVNPDPLWTFSSGFNFIDYHSSQWWQIELKYIRENT